VIGIQLSAVPEVLRRDTWACEFGWHRIRVVLPAVACLVVVGIRVGFES